MRSFIRRPFRATVQILGMGILASYLLSIGILYFTQERFLFPGRRLPPDFVYSFDGRFDEIALPVDGATLAAAKFSRPGAKGVVLYLHGNGGTVADVGWAADAFVRRGYDALLVDYRGYGKSSGALSSEADLLADAEAAYAYLLRDYREEQIVVYGHSLGSGLAVHLAASHTPRLLILESPFVSMQDVVAQQAPYVPAFLLKYPLRSDRWIGAVRCPVYLFHGTLDDLIPFDSSERLRALITAPSHMIPVIGAGHSNIPTFAIYQQQLDQILH
jgi:alpha-beta hydrolase superfamily lysophospholipase